MVFKGAYCWLIQGKRSYLGSGVWKGLFRCCLSLPQHAGGPDVSTVDDGLGVVFTQGHLQCCLGLRPWESSVMGGGFEGLHLAHGFGEAQDNLGEDNNNTFWLLPV